ncbi:MAG: hypothetical protein ABIJ00_11495 [Candidatus Eisenbacteria bacterium]
MFVPAPRPASILLLALAGILGALTPVHAQDGIDGMRLVGRNDIQYAHLMHFHIVGDYAYCLNGYDSGLETYYIADPANPTRVSRGGVPSWRGWSRNDTLFTFCHDMGIQMFDISAGTPALLGSYDPPDPDVFYEGGVAVGSLLYVAAHQLGIHVLDIGSPGGPTFVSELPLADNACWNITEAGGYLFVANGRFGVSVVDLAGGPGEVATLSLPGLANDIIVSGTSVFLSLAAEGIASVDISDPTHPVLLDRAPTMGNAFSMGAVGDILAVGSYTYLERFDIGDPGDISLVGWDATHLWALGADVGVISSGDTVIAVADWQGMGVYLPRPDLGGDIDVYPLRLDFGPVGATPRDTTVFIRNNGAGTLTVDSTWAPTGISLSPQTFSLGPGLTQPVTVTASGAGTVRGGILYISNDPDEPQSVQHVYKNSTTFLGVGVEAPDFTLLGLDSVMHSLSDYRGKVVFLEFGACW